MPGAVPGATIPELDTTTRLQLAVSDLCGLYSNALGRLLNAVEERAGPSEPAVELLAADLGLQVAKAHRGIDDLTDELRRKLHSEATQLQRLRVLELEHSAVTRELRIEVEAAEPVLAALRTDLDALLDGVQELSQQRFLLT